MSLKDDSEDRIGPPQPTAPRHKPVQALQRGLRLLQIISERPGGLSLKELAAEIGVSTAATFHLVHTLVDAGFVQRVEHPARYLPGNACAVLAQGRQDDLVRETAHAGIAWLAERLPEATIYFCEFLGSSVVAHTHFSLRRGRLVTGDYRHILPPYASAGSFAHLAFWPQDRVDAYEARHPFDLYGLPYWRSHEAYAKALEEMRREAVFVMPEASPLCLKLSVPLFRPGGVLVGSYTLQGRAASPEVFEETRAHYLSLAQQAAAEFTKRIAL